MQRISKFFTTMFAPPSLGDTPPATSEQPTSQANMPRPSAPPLDLLTAPNMYPSPLRSQPAGYAGVQPPASVAWQPAGAASGSAPPLIGARAANLLRVYDTVFVMDDSLSMLFEDRWNKAREGVALLVQEAVKYDTDGIDLYFFNNQKTCRLHNMQDVQEMFRNVAPDGMTPMGAALERVLQPYMQRFEAAWRRGQPQAVKPLNVIVATDGQPDDQPHAVVAKVAQHLDRLGAPARQVGVQFFVVGEDPAAIRFVNYMDDQLARDYHTRDIVDGSSLKLARGALGEQILKVLTGAIDANIDSMGSLQLSAPRPW